MAKMVSMIIAVIGSTFPNRLSYFESLDTAKYPSVWNLFIDPETVELIWCAHGGLTLERLHRDLWLSVEGRGCIDAAVLQIGSNDMCDIEVQDFVSCVMGESIPALMYQGCAHVTLTKAFYCHPGYYATGLNLELYSNKIHLLNESLKESTPNSHQSSLHSLPHHIPIPTFPSSCHIWETSQVQNASTTYQWVGSNIHHHQNHHYLTSAILVHIHPCICFQNLRRQNQQQQT